MMEFVFSNDLLREIDNQIIADCKIIFQDGGETEGKFFTKGKRLFQLQYHPHESVRSARKIYHLAKIVVTPTERTISEKMVCLVKRFVLRMNIECI